MTQKRKNEKQEPVSVFSLFLHHHSDRRVVMCTLMGNCTLLDGIIIILKHAYEN